jgi:hypothetical protein
MRFGGLIVSILPTLGFACMIRLHAVASYLKNRNSELLLLRWRRATFTP